MQRQTNAPQNNTSIRVFVNCVVTNGECFHVKYIKRGKNDVTSHACINENVKDS